MTNVVAKPATGKANPEATSNKTIDTLIQKAAGHLGSFRETVQDAAIAIIEHANTYGDCSRAKNLCRVVPSRERNMLVGYFALYSPIGVSMGKTAADDKCRFIRTEAKNYHDFNIDGAKANKWYDDPAKVSPEPKPLNTLTDFYESMDSLLRRMIAQAEADEEKNKWQPEIRSDLREQAKEIRGILAKYRAKHLANANNNGELEKQAA